MGVFSKIPNPVGRADFNPLVIWDGVDVRVGITTGWSNCIEDTPHMGQAFDFPSGLRKTPKHLRKMRKAVAFHQQGDLAAAKKLYADVLRIDANDFDALHMSGLIAYQLKNFVEAERFFTKAGKLKPDFPGFHLNHGLLLQDLNRLEEALVKFDEAISLEKRYSEAYSNRGNVLIQMKRFEEALAACDQAIEIKRDNAKAHYNRGCSLQNLDRFDSALASYENAIILDPVYASAFNNRGHALENLLQFEDAIASYNRAIMIKPDYAEAFSNLGNALQQLKRFGEAIGSLHKAASIDSTSAETYHNLSYILLLLGQFEDGLAFYEWRKKSADPKGNRSFNKPLWTGVEDLFQKTILVHWEQGLGDTIQFCRYIRLLGERGAKVLFAPQKPLRPLLATLDGACEIVDEDDPALAFDFHCPLLSLPLVFKTRVSDIPAREAYLRAEGTRVEKWKAIIGHRGLKVGVCWQGSTGKIDAGRSFSLGEFQALLQIRGLRLISLHKGAGEAQLADIPQGMSVETLGPDFDAGPDAFLDTAAAMMCCDLVVTSDTAVAHLAGALGVKTWVAVKHVPDWRWFLDRSDSPWYPSMRLFRQHRHGDWNGVFRDISVALQDEFGLR